MATIILRMILDLQVKSARHQSMSSYKCIVKMFFRHVKFIRIIYYLFTYQDDPFQKLR